VDQDKVLKQGVAISDVYQTIQAYMGGLFVNYFNDFGRTWQVYIEAEAPYERYARPFAVLCAQQPGPERTLSALANFETDYGPEFTLRYNEYRAAQIFGSAAPVIALNRRPRPSKMFPSNHAPRNGLRLHGHVLSGAESTAGCAAWAIFALSLLFVF